MKWFTFLPILRDGLTVDETQNATYTLEQHRIKVVVVLRRIGVDMIRFSLLKRVI